MRPDREIDLLPTRVVGRRREAKPTPQGTDALLRTVRDLRGGVARRGLYRFDSFEEAQEWIRREAACAWFSRIRRP